MQLIEIFRAGKQTDRNGLQVSITKDDLQQAVDSYDVAFHESPVVIGHPKHNHPAYAWVKGLQLDGDVLKAELDQVDPEFAEMVEKGRFKKVSASFYLADSPNNPKKGSLYLRHVGFLGAMPPAVKGLRNPEFADNENGIVDFCDEPTPEPESPQTEPNPTAQPEGEPEMSAEDKAELERLKAENEQLKADKAKAEAEKAEAELNRTKAENADFAESLVKAGKLTPANKAAAVDLLNFAAVQASGGVLEFEEGESLLSKTKAFLTAQPKVLEFGEQATKANAPEDTTDGTVEYAEGTAPESIEADQKIRAYMKANSVDYRTAFKQLYS